MIKITKEDLESPTGTFNLRMAQNIHKKIKAEAAMRKLSKTEMLRQLILSGIEHLKEQ